MQDVTSDFVAETRDDLLRVEAYLAALASNPNLHEPIADLFRVFHTIKGSSALLELPEFEQIADRIEEQLSRVRDGRAPWRTETSDAVAHAVDALRSLLGKLGGQEPSDGSEPVDRILRVDVAIADRMAALVGELVVVRNELAAELDAQQTPELFRLTQRVRSIATALSDQISKSRLQSLGPLFLALPRLVRDVARQCHKEVQLQLEGGSIALDKSLNDAIRDPVTHILRNAIDHGIETPDEREKLGKSRVGTIRVAASQQPAHVVITVSDDGAGLDRTRIGEVAVSRGLVTQEQLAAMTDPALCDLVCSEGFSTAPGVTSISGRGVGLDVVKTEIERLGGTFEIDSAPHIGTTCRIRLPLTLVVVPSLIVRSGGEAFALSLFDVVEVTPRAGDAPLSQIPSRDKALPIVDLATALASTSSHSTRNIILQTGDVRFSLAVDEVDDAVEVVVKALPRLIRSFQTPFSGVATLPHGEIAIALDTTRLARFAQARPA